MEFLKIAASFVAGLAIVAFSLGSVAFVYGVGIMLALWWTTKVLGWVGF